MTQNLNLITIAIINDINSLHSPDFDIKIMRRLRNAAQFTNLSSGFL